MSALYSVTYTIKRVKFVFKLKGISDGTLATNFRRVACDVGNSTDVEKVAHETYFANSTEVDEHV